MSVSNVSSEGESFISELGWRCLARKLKLSDREIEIARAVLKDQTERAIARRLGISPHTVHTHLERLYRKLQVSSRLELAVRLFQTLLMLTAEPGSPLPPVCGRRAAGRCPFAE
jgi:DNA-binding CsgD family transcriptional regulator